MVQPPHAIRLYAPDHPDLPLTVVRQLEKERAELLENLLLCDPLDFPYRKGFIRGIERAMEIVQDTDKRLSER